MAPAPISPEEARRRKIVGVNGETVTNVASTNFPGHYPGEDHEWSLEKFSQSFEIQFHKNEPLDASFSLIGIDASIANAFRRIMIAEIPTLAIESIFVHNNNTIVHDEVLAARLGLVPLTASLSGLNWLQFYKKPATQDGDGEEDDRDPAADNNTIVLKLHVECDWRGAEGVKSGETDPEKLYVNSSVYAKQITFEPTGRQNKEFPEPDGHVRPVNPEILLAKMRPGQVIDLDMHCIKGVGSDHAKFSPVATATYRLLPTIDIVKPIVGNDARKFARCFPKGVIGLEDVTEEESEMGGEFEGMAGEKKAVVRNTFKDTVSRECLRHEEFQGKVKLGRVRDHFIFSVESTGQFASDYLFLESVKTLKAKCSRLKRQFANVMR